MPDLLLIPLDNKSVFELEKLGSEEGFRVKTVIDLSNAKDWLKLREFDAMLLDARISIEEQQNLAGLLWQKNSLAHFVVYDFESASAARGPEVRLMGAELAVGPKAFDQIRAVLKGVRPVGSLNREKFSVLVVEDLDSPRDIICTYLESLGFPDVTGVGSAKEALGLLNSEPGRFSCILTDIRMPQMTGAEMIAVVRQDKRHTNIPVIVLTAYGTADCLVDCLRSGASGFLVKPPKRQDLMRELSRALRIKAEGISPRLAAPEEAELLREMLVDKLGSM